MDGFDLDRFVRAQAPVIETVLAELRTGAKRSHWMWFVFPQVGGLGHSAMAQRYGLSGLDEAAAYLAHPVLGARLIECSRLVNAVPRRTATQIFSTPDDLKFRSCMTLFALVPDAPPDFAQALDRYFDGVPDPRTLSLCRPGASGRR